MNSNVLMRVSTNSSVLCVWRRGRGREHTTEEVNSSLPIIISHSQPSIQRQLSLTWEQFGPISSQPKASNRENPRIFAVGIHADIAIARASRSSAPHSGRARPASQEAHLGALPCGNRCEIGGDGSVGGADQAVARQVCTTRCSGPAPKDAFVPRNGSGVEKAVFPPCPIAVVRH